MEVVGRGFRQPHGLDCGTSGTLAAYWKGTRLTVSAFLNQTLLYVHNVGFLHKFWKAKAEKSTDSGKTRSFSTQQYIDYIHCESVNQPW